MLIGYVTFVLFSPFEENVVMKWDLDFTMIDRDCQSADKQKYAQAYVCEEEKKIAAFKHSCEENCGVS